MRIVWEKFNRNKSQFFGVPIKLKLWVSSFWRNCHGCILRVPIILLRANGFSRKDIEVYFFRFLSKIFGNFERKMFGRVLKIVICMTRKTFCGFFIKNSFFFPGFDFKKSPIFLEIFRQSLQNSFLGFKRKNLKIFFKDLQYYKWFPSLSINNPKFRQKVFSSVVRTTL